MGDTSRHFEGHGLYHKKVKFPLKISDRAWWLEVLVLKNPGKSSRRKGNGPQDMEIDHVGMVPSFFFLDNAALVVTTVAVMKIC